MRNREIVATLLVMGLVACGPPPRDTGGGGGGGDTPDAGTGSGSGSGSGVGSDPGGDSNTFVYAHTSSTLFKIDPDTFAITEIGDFQWSAGDDQMTDLAIDKTGTMIGVSFTAVYKVDPTTAKATQLNASLATTFNGLSFVPATAIGGSGDDVLVGTSGDDGTVFQVDPSTGATTEIGNMGGAFASSGDLVAVDGFGTVQTVPGGDTGGDVLVTLAPNSFTATAAAQPTGFGAIWGVAFWKNKVFGFTDNGEFITIDPSTGVGTLISTSSNQWWGAAVTTTAPVIQ